MTDLVQIRYLESSCKYLERVFFFSFPPTPKIKDFEKNHIYFSSHSKQDYIEKSSFSNLFVTSPTSQLILQPLRRFTYITSHSPTLPLLHLRHSSFSNTSFASPTSEALHLRHLASRPCLVWYLVALGHSFYKQSYCTSIVSQYYVVSETMEESLCSGTVMLLTNSSIFPLPIWKSVDEEYKRWLVNKGGEDKSQKTQWSVWTELAWVRDALCHRPLPSAFSLLTATAISWPIKHALLLISLFIHISQPKSCLTSGMCWICRCEYLIYTQTMWIEWQTYRKVNADVSGTCRPNALGSGLGLQAVAVP